MSNAERGRLTVEVKGQTYQLALTINALCELEDQLGVSFQEAMQQAGKGSIRHVRAFIWAALRESHPDMTLQQAGEWLQEAGGVEGLQSLLGGLHQSVMPAASDRKALGLSDSKRPRGAAPVNGIGAASRSKRDALA